MPEPLVPPDPDLPQPIRFSPSDELSAFPLNLSGMAPHLEHARQRFNVEGAVVTVMMLHEQDAGRYAYRGVAVADLDGLQTLTSARLSVQNATNGKTRVEKFPVERAEWPASLVSVTHRVDADGSVRFNVQARLPASAETHAVVAVPLSIAPPVFARFADYVAMAAWATVTPSKPATVLTVRPNGAKRYGLFVATGAPSDLRPRSAVTTRAVT